MLGHVPLPTVRVAEEPHMAQLVQFVVADGGDHRMGHDIGHVGGGGGKHGDAGAGESDLGCGSEHQRPARIAGPRRHVEDIVISANSPSK